MADFDAFNFDSMKEAVGSDPFAQTSNKYARDERFYTLTKDKEGNGAALLRFLPDSEKGMIQKMFKINTTITKNGKKRFVNEYTPATIGAPCPFQEEWQKLWNAGDKEGAKNYSRSIVYVSNVKVIKDPAAPENDGKVFLYQYSGAMLKKLEAALNPSAEQRALGATPKELFNPVQGNSFRLVAQRGSNGQINYDASEVLPTVDGIYESVEAAVQDIKDNTHKLSGLIAPEAFMTYEQLQDKFKWVTFADQEAPVAPVQAAPVAEVAVVAPVATPEVQTVETPVAAAPVTPDAPKPANQGTSLDDLLGQIS